jgi:hypothetical protein
LRDRVEDGGDASEVAAAAAIIWREIDGALRPLIGQRGVVALFNRSVQLASVSYPWVVSVRQDANLELQFPAIADVFARQDPAAAIAGGDAQLLAFQQLLRSLIGASLAERLLRPTFSPANASTPAQDFSNK